MNTSFALKCAIYTAGSGTENTHPIEIKPLQVPIHDTNGELIACREQLPLVPAYAITVHRSQSLSMDNVAIDFTKSIVKRWAPEGLVYVALSRCKSLSGLWVRGLQHEFIQTSTVAHTLMHEVGKVMFADGNRVITGPHVAMDLVFYLSLELSQSVGKTAHNFIEQKRKRRRLV